MFQLHYLFQIRVAGDIFVSEENIEETDFQNYLNNTCTMWVKCQVTCMNVWYLLLFNLTLKVFVLWKSKLLPQLLHLVLPDVCQVHLCPLCWWPGSAGSDDVQHHCHCHHSNSIRVGMSVWQYDTMTNIILNHLVRFLCSMTLDILLTPGETIKEKICMLKNIEKFSIFTQENEDRRDHSLKYKLILTFLIFLFELSNQYFCHSARCLRFST